MTRVTMVTIRDLPKGALWSYVRHLAKRVPWLNPEELVRERVAVFTSMEKTPDYPGVTEATTTITIEEKS